MKVVHKMSCECGSTILLHLKEDHGFWLPNDFVDLYADELGPRGVYIYCVIARAATPTLYPSVSDLSYRAKASLGDVRKALAKMRRLNLLNDFDLQRIRGYEEDENVHPSIVTEGGLGIEI